MNLSTTSFGVQLNGAGKKFFRNWIFKNLTYRFEPASKVSVIGQNGSGKSTLLQVLAGYESLSEGTIHFFKGEKVIPREEVFYNVAIAAPYLELVEEFTLEEIIKFHFKFKKPVKNLSTSEIMSLTQLESSGKKVFKYFSSGMKQRTKLALAMLSDAELILLDEPLSNLDKSSELWYRELAESYLMDKVVVVCSNQNEAEYFFCSQSINISTFK